ncbi:MAG: prepilin-type N-terminal cleavage/methylation domain-containing protein [bacterium]
MKSKCNFGFTLIELLIVVAIIAILAAIAIPNFLAAQTRSKVSKLKAEFKTLATAIESYNVDANSYPIYDSLGTGGGGKNGVFGDDNYNSNRFDLLTTPVAYITSVPQDPFRFVGIGGSAAGQGIGYFLYTWDTFAKTAAESWHSGTPGPGPASLIWHASYWSLRSRGPNGKWDSAAPGGYTVWAWWDRPPYAPDGDVFLGAYDPSNGTVSGGDLWRTSKNGQY